MINQQPQYEAPTIEDIACDGETLATASMITGA